MNIAVILAGGVGSRLGLDKPKQFMKMAGKTILEHTVDVFQKHDKIDEIVSHVKKSSSISELSFRQMIDKNYQTTDYCQDYLQQGHKKDWYYIEQCDYNMYFVEGELYDHYEDLKKK